MSEVDLEPLTPRQAKVLAYIGEHIKELGYPPTVRDIGEAMGIGSPNGVVCHLLTLERKGRIERDAHVSRGMRILEDA